MVAFFFKSRSIYINPSETLLILNQIWSAATHLRKIWLSHAHLCCRRSLFTCKRGRGLRRSVQTRTRWPRPLWPERSVCFFHRTGSISSDESRSI